MPTCYCPCQSQSWQCFRPLPLLTPFQSSTLQENADLKADRARTFDQCWHDEAEALEQLKSQGSQFIGGDKSSCLSSATIGGFTSYVDLLTCLEMARDAKKSGR
jgi:hypothetical protein